MDHHRDAAELFQGPTVQRWHVKEVVDDPSEADIAGVRDIVSSGKKQNEEQLAQLSAAVEAALVTKTVPKNEEAPEQPLGSSRRAPIC